MSRAEREKALAKADLYREESKDRTAKAVIAGLKPKRVMSGVVWEDKVNGREYQRIIGGCAWPGAESFTRTCHMAILGEDTQKDPASGRPKIWLVAEETAQSVEELLDKVCMRMETTVCRDWVMPVDEPEYIRVENWLRERRRCRRPVPQVLDAPITRFLELNALMQARTVTTKSFYFGPDSIAAAAYASVSDQDFSRQLNRFPQIGAVLYPLGYLDTVEKRDVRRAPRIPAEGGY